MSKYQRRFERALKGKSIVSDFHIQAPSILEHRQERGSTAARMIMRSAMQERGIHCSAPAGGRTSIDVRDRNWRLADLLTSKRLSS
jgi:hypothetical protein